MSETFWLEYFLFLLLKFVIVLLFLFHIDQFESSYFKIPYNRHFSAGRISFISVVDGGAQRTWHNVQRLKTDPKERAVWCIYSFDCQRTVCQKDYRSWTRRYVLRHFPITFLCNRSFEILPLLYRWRRYTISVPSSGGYPIYSAADRVARLLRYRRKEAQPIRTGGLQNATDIESQLVRARLVLL